MTPDLKAIRERCEAATPGPWRISKKKGPLYRVRVVSSHGNFLCVGHHCDIDDSGAYKRRSNYNFIAHARTDIPALLDYIAELEKQLQPTTELQRKCPACGGLGYAKEKP